MALEKNLNFSLSFRQAGLTFCLPRATSCLSLLMIWLENEVPGPLPIGQVSFKSYLPSKKIYLCWTVRSDFFQALIIKGSFGGRVAKVIKMESFRKLGNFNFQWTKTLYHNNKARAIDVIISYL